MPNDTWFWLFMLVICILCVVIWRNRRTVSDGKALWWATVSEPIAYVSDDPFDETVTERAANARALLEEHGNQYLNQDTDVWEFVYAATPQTPTRDFSLWQDIVRLEIIKRREVWRQQKAEWNGQAAKEHFGGQRPPTVEWDNSNQN